MTCTLSFGVWQPKQEPAFADSSHHHHILLSMPVIMTNDPHTLLFSLGAHNHDTLLSLHHSAIGKSGYDIKEMHQCHSVLDFLELNHGMVPANHKYNIVDGVHMPSDLADVTGLWQTLIPFSFCHIKLLNLILPDAVIWLILILTATNPSTPLCCIILHDCPDWNRQALPFLFKDLNLCINAFPAAKLLIGWGWGLDLVQHFEEAVKWQLLCWTAKGALWYFTHPVLIVSHTSLRFIAICSTVCKAILPGGEWHLGMLLYDSHTKHKFHDLYAPGQVNDNKAHVILRSKTWKNGVSMEKW